MNSIGEGQHWFEGLGNVMPASDISPNRLTPLRRPGLQDRTFVIPDQLVVVADTHLAGWQSRRAALGLGPLLRPARQVRDRAGAKRGRLEPRKGGMSPYT